jgi:hypothetical protein
MVALSVVAFDVGRWYEHGVAQRGAPPAAVTPAAGRR